MPQIDIHTDVFNSVYLPYLQDTKPLQIFFGGSSSGKSYFLAERAVFDLLQGGRNYLICRQFGGTLRGSVVQEIRKVITTWGLDKFFSVNKTDGTITCISNGYQCVFSGLDDVEKLKSITPARGVFTDVWVEEATEIERESLKQLEKRLRGGSEKTKKRITLSFNPIMQTHWIYQEYFSGLEWADGQALFQDDNILIVKTIYLDNGFLTAQDRQQLEREKDSYYYQVYTLGNWGILGDVIFTKVSIRDLSGEMAQFVNHRSGLDFGFASDPAAMPVMHYDRMRKQLFIYDEIYERGLTNDMLAGEIKKKIGIFSWVEKRDDKGRLVRDEKNEIVYEYKCTSTRPLICDSAEPKSIQELQNAGVNAYAAKKGKDSVNFGVQWLQQQEIIIDSKCIHAKQEFTTYHWKKDKDGNSMKVPADRDNHLIDATRYALEEDMLDEFYFSG